MNSKELGRTIIMVALIGVLILLAVDTRVTAQEGDEDMGEIREPVTVPGGPGFISISPTGFRPMSPEMGWAYDENYELYNTMASTILYATTAVYLPDGVDVTQVTVYYYADNFILPSVDAWLIRTPLSGGSYTEMAYLTYYTDTGYNFETDTTIQEPTIDNQNYAYFVKVGIGSFGPSLRLTGLRLDYEYTTYLSTIMK